MLKVILESLEGLSDEVKEHYVEKDGKHYLAVTKVDGLGVENIDGLRSTVEKQRQAERELTKSLKAANDELKVVTEKFKDIDPDSARSALSKIDEIKDWDGETKVREAVSAAEQRMQAKIDELAKQHSTEKESLQSELTNSQDQLQDAIVTSKIVEAIHAQQGNVSLLMPHVRNQVEMTKDSHGKWRPEVINADGNPRIGDSVGNSMTITQLVEEMKSQETFAAAFPGANQTGGGKTGSSQSGTHKKAGEGKVVAASDSAAISKNLDDIASGKVTVDMDK